jgi:hypothetical protein
MKIPLMNTAMVNNEKMRFKPVITPTVINLVYHGKDRIYANKIASIQPAIQQTGSCKRHLIAGILNGEMLTARGMTVC